MGVASDGDERRLDLYRFVAWLAARRDRSRKDSAGMLRADAPQPGLTGYERHKEAMRQRSAEQSLAGRDIGDMPAVQDPERRERAKLDLRLYCETYHGATFQLAWSRDHLRVIRKLEDAILRGALLAIAMPRGSGKTSLIEAAALWAVLYGHRRFVVLVGADKDHAVNMLDSIKSDVETNSLLEQDFPEVCFPVLALEGIHQRAPGQLYQGAPTRISWTNEEIILPTIPDAPSSGSILRVAGITGRIRGMKHKLPDGSSARPDLVLIDDPQTDESAKSPTQCASRERVVSGAVLGMAGPGKTIAGLMTITVIHPGDMADRILDRKLHPRWQAERTKLAYKLPSNEKHWARYAELRLEDLAREDSTLKSATDYYRRHQSAMDKGADVAWPERYLPHELSAVQHVMNLKLADEVAFAAEYQNEPLRAEAGPKAMLDADAIAQRLNLYQRGEVPPECTHITMFVDVQKTLLYWLVVGWGSSYTGHVLDYGAWPDQGREYYTLRDARRTIELAHPGLPLDAALYASLASCTHEQLTRSWRRHDGVELRVDRCLVDANWEKSADVVYELCRSSPHAAILMPSRGKFYGASSNPMNDHKRQPGERVGPNWRIPKPAAGRSTRHVAWDTNAWKSRVAAGLVSPKGTPGGIWLYGKNAKLHRMLSEQLSSETPVRVSARGREVDEWKQRVDRPDNHWWDCLVGAAVAASIAGLQSTVTAAPKARRKINLAELWSPR